MRSSEEPERAGNPHKEGGFANLLDRHLNFGTRPTGSPALPGKRWSNKEFAHAVGGVDERTVRNWRAGRSRPSEIGSIERGLFGNNDAYCQWRFDLRVAYDRRPSSPIPPPPPYFLGRDEDVDIILDVLLASSSNRAILVQGGPGIGKSSLTQAVGCHPDIIHHFDEANRWFVPLETATTAAAMGDAIIRALGGDPARGLAGVLMQLRAQPGLLVLDNLETPWSPRSERSTTESMLTELATVPGLGLLASFRGRSRVSGPAWGRVLPVTQLSSPDSTELFRRIAQQTFPEDPELPRFIAALGGIPLAIELVASRAHGRTTLGSLWTEWTRVGTALAVKPEFDAGRLTSLPHSIELSLSSDRMNPVARRLFCLLGQLPAGVAVQDRDDLLGVSGLDAEEILLNLGLAVEHPNRLDLLPPIRDHALRHQKPAAPDDTTWPAHFLDLTRRLGEVIGTTADTGAIARLTPELANIEAAIRAVLVAGDRQRAMDALGGFGNLTYSAHLSSAVLDDLAMACRRDGDTLGAANCIKSLGDIALVRSDYAAARTAYEQALPLYREIGDAIGEARCIDHLKEIALARSDYATARTACEQALPLYRQVGDVRGEANCIKGLADIALELSDFTAAWTTYEQALALYRQIGCVTGEANCIKALGNIAFERSDYAAALAEYEQALALYRQISDVLGEANCIRSLGNIAMVRADHAAAKTEYEQALALYRQIGDVVGEANCIKNVGDIALARADHAAAQTEYEQALALYRQIGNVIGEANCIMALGSTALARPDHAALLYPPPPAVATDQRPVPDWAEVHRELRRPNMTLESPVSPRQTP